MNRLAVLVARTAVVATVPMALAQATASPLTEIEVGAWLDPYIAAPTRISMDVIPALVGMARDALIQRSLSASASVALTVHPVTAANNSRKHDTNGSVPMPNPLGIDKSSRAQAVGP